MPRTTTMETDHERDDDNEPILDDIFDVGGEVDGIHYDGVAVAPLTDNVFCPTGPGGGVDATCSPGGGDAEDEGSGDEPKKKSTTVGKAEHVHAARVEQEVANGIRGRWMEDNEYFDAAVGKDRVEVKSLLVGKKNTISVHDDALLRKVDGVRREPGAVMHTVAVDERGTFGDGAHAHKASGHRLYYKRGCGRYALSKMHKVSSMKELRALIAMKDHELPEAARGSLPSGRKEIAELRVRAREAHAARLTKDRKRKAKMKADKQAKKDEENES